MKTVMQPTKTEYKGIVFDSKSEAVFARALDEAGNHWVYHPAIHCDHEWDFLVFPYGKEVRRSQVLVGNKFYADPRSFPSKPPVLVEYKPSEPTMTYVRNLTKQMIVKPFNSVVVWGNPWAGPISENPYNLHCYAAYPIFSNECRYGWGEFNPMADSGEDRPFSSIDVTSLFGVSLRGATEASKFRFDLR